MVLQKVVVAVSGIRRLRFDVISLAR